MSRSARLLELLHLLRRYRHPVSARRLAERLETSLRTVYRDIGALQALGADIRGEPGLGYVLVPGFLLPPLMFTPEEIEALALGADWVASRSDRGLREAALSAFARIVSVLPEDARVSLEHLSLMAGPPCTQVAPGPDPDILRRAIRLKNIIRLSYTDAQGNRTERTLWPCALAYFDSALVLVAWCKLREEFRHFRLDRIAGLEITDDRYPRDRKALMREWQKSRNIEAWYVDPDRK
ncbi:helix-turn-helix transcriptional regulator [Swaminathania salitolerans]|uniref:Transcriptional regulator n=1 Tax=Swaminathania salitolerans TaxID=182838 RepID=A0A511BQ73_9PROT|nr:YafY family protein [Swaminathania salitolerans]GBQ11415.1 transcriptional regulator [Swaminathania salitolerans LMG 21291]GEL02470.1 transcriptional regulator [Swaminathania salitolerans]